MCAWDGSQIFDQCKKSHPFVIRHGINRSTSKYPKMVSDMLLDLMEIK